MRIYLRQWGAFWTVVGLATSLLAFSTVTPASARPKPHGYHDGAAGPEASARRRDGRIGSTSSRRDRAHRVDRSGYRGRRVRQARQAERRRSGAGIHRTATRRTDDRRHQSLPAWDAGDAGRDQRYAVGRQATAGRSGSSVVSEARRWVGTNPTNRRSLWCGTFMNFVLERTGHRGTGSDLARSFAALGQRVSGPQVGAIAVMARRGGGHVGVVSGVDDSGNPIIISGNHGRKVAETVYPRGRVYAYVMPQ